MPTGKVLTFDANERIIGLGPAPWRASELLDWPTEGYDGTLCETDWEEDDVFAKSGHTREEWLALADEMIARWTAWRAHCAAL